MRKIEELTIYEEYQDEPSFIRVCDNCDVTGKVPYFIEIVNDDGTGACIGLTENQVEELVAVFIGGK